MKIKLLITLSLLPTLAWADVVKDFLKENKTYTDNLISYYSTADTNKVKLAEINAQLKKDSSELKNAESILKQTQNSLAQNEATLLAFKDKLKNKATLETDANLKKQSLTTELSSINSQIQSVSSQLNSINLTLSTLQNERLILDQRARTQNQLVNLAQTNINNINFDNNRMNNQITQNEREIRNLQSNLQRFESELLTTTDEAKKIELKNRIRRHHERIRDMRDENNRLQASIRSTSLQLSTEQTKLIQAQSELSSLNILINGKQAEIDSQERISRQLTNSLDSLNREKANVTSSIRGVTNEIATLGNLPDLIAKTEQVVKSLTASKVQFEKDVTAARSKAQVTATQLETFANTLESNETAILQEEAKQNQAIESLINSNALTVTPSTTSVTAPSALPSSPVAMSTSSLVLSEEISSSKDWSTFKGHSETMAQDVCVATTNILDKQTGILSELVVVKLINKDDSYSSPFIIVTQTMTPDFVIKGDIKTDRRKAKNMVMPLLQSQVKDEKALISKYSDTQDLIKLLKSDNIASVELTIPSAPQSLKFSLRGSSAMISKFESVCKN